MDTFFLNNHILAPSIIVHLTMISKQRLALCWIRKRQLFIYLSVHAFIAQDTVTIPLIQDNVNTYCPHTSTAKTKMWLPLWQGLMYIVLPVVAHEHLVLSLKKTNLKTPNNCSNDCRKPTISFSSVMHITWWHYLEQTQESSEWDCLDNLQYTNNSYHSTVSLTLSFFYLFIFLFQIYNSEMNVK